MQPAVTVAAVVKPPVEDEDDDDAPVLASTGNSLLDAIKVDKLNNNFIFGCFP